MDKAQGTTPASHAINTKRDYRNPYCFKATVEHSKALAVRATSIVVAIRLVSRGLIASRATFTGEQIVKISHRDQSGYLIAGR
jgi:hypothetical protein